MSLSCHSLNSACIQPCMPFQSSLKITEELCQRVVRKRRNITKYLELCDNESCGVCAITKSGFNPCQFSRGIHVTYNSSKFADYPISEGHGGYCSMLLYALLLLERLTNCGQTNQTHLVLPVATTLCVERGRGSLILVLRSTMNLCCIIPVPFAHSTSLFIDHSSWHRDRSFSALELPLFFNNPKL